MSRHIIGLAHEEMGVEVEPSEKSEFLKLTVLYMFKRIRAVAYTKRLHKFLNDEGYEIKYDGVINLRKRLDANGYILNRLKPFLFYCYKKGLDTRKRICKAAEKFGIQYGDRKIALLMQNKSIQEQMEPLKKYSALSYKALQARLHEIPEIVAQHTRNFIYRKMRFIVNNQHFATDIDDVFNDLVSKGIQNILTTYPCIESSKHAANIARMAINNHGINQIYYFTREGRGIIKQSEDGTFFSNVVPITDNVQEAMDTLVCASHQDPFATQRQHYESVSDCHRVLKMYSGKKRVAISALMGFYIPEFSAWLRQQARPTHRMSNDDLFDTLNGRNLESYIRYLSEYLQVEADKILKVGKQACRALAA